MKTALIVLFAVVTVAVGANINKDAIERIIRGTSEYKDVARANAAASGYDAAANTHVLDTAGWTLSEANAEATRGAAVAQSSVGVSQVEKND